MYRFCHKRATTLSIYASRPEISEVSRLATRCFRPFRVLHHDHDCAQHLDPHDEGKHSYNTPILTLENFQNTLETRWSSLLVIIRVCLLNVKC